MFSDIKLVQVLKLLLFQVKHIDSVTLEDAVELLRYPVTLVYQHQILISFFFLSFCNNETHSARLHVRESILRTVAQLR